MKSVTEFIFAMQRKHKAASEVVFRCIYTLFNTAQRDMEYFNLQLQMHK